MKRTTVFVDEALQHDLKAIAARRGRPVATLVREALAEYVAGDKRRRRTNPSFVAAGASGRADTSDWDDEALWPQQGRVGSGRRSR